MPSISIHEKVGYEIAKRIGINSYDYYLGLLAPDAPNLNGFAPKEERWKAHQRKQDYDEWRNSIDHFYLSAKDHYPKDFLVGYYIHILTDIVYDDFFYLKVREKILKDYSLEESHHVMSNDMSHYSFPEWKNIQEILLQDSISYDILNISSQQLLLWKEKQLASQKGEQPCHYVTDDVIDDLQEQVLKEYLSKIESFNKEKSHL